MKDFFKLAFVNLRQRVLRTLLTMIGIFIGIAAVVALISLGQGLQNAVNKEFSSVGGDKIIIEGRQAGFGPPGSNTAGAVGEKDKEVIEKVAGIKVAAGRTFRGVTVEFQGEQQVQFVISIPDEPKEASLVISALNLKILKGRVIRKNEKDSIVAGYLYSEKDGVFGKRAEIGNKIIVQGKPFEIVGIADRRGDASLDKGIFMTDAAVKTIFDTTEFNAIVAQTEQGVDVTTIAERVRRAIRQDRHQKEGKEDFTVSTSEELIASFNRILTIVQAVIIGIAAISLLVGGIGIMNTMFTSVLERTKEIGIMKAVGATNKQIMTLFLIESGMLGIVGGAIGVLIGVGLSKSVELAAQQFWGPNLLQASVPWYLVVGALTFSFFIGTMSGVMPARRAAKLRPVDALRYE